MITACEHFFHNDNVFDCTVQWSLCLLVFGAPPHLPAHASAYNTTIHVIEGLAPVAYAESQANLWAESKLYICMHRLNMSRNALT